MTNYKFYQCIGQHSYAVKIQFEGSSKIYEYAWEGGAQVPSPMPNNLFALIDARGVPKIVKVKDIVPYGDKWFQGELKPIHTLFTGDILWTKAEGAPQEEKRRSPLDDEIPF